MKAVEISEKPVFCVRNTRYFAFESVPAFARPNHHVTCPCDVKLLTSLEVNMAEKGKRQRGGRRCVAGLPNGESCENNTYTENITMHQFPTEPVVRAQWVRFVQRHRVDFAEPVNKYACLCSAHFEEDCFTMKPSIQGTLDGMEGIKMNKRIITGSVPTRHTNVPPGPEVLSARQKRMVRFDSFNLFYNINQ